MMLAFLLSEVGIPYFQKISILISCDLKIFHKSIEAKSTLETYWGQHKN